MGVLRIDLLTMAGQKELEKLRAQDQREIKARKKELQRKEKAMVTAVAGAGLLKMPVTRPTVAFFIVLTDAAQAVQKADRAD